MFRNSLLIFGVAASVAVVTPAQADVFATCGASYGQAHYDGEAGWVADRITGGTFTFVFDVKGNPNILFKDARGGVVDASADGAEIYIAFADSERGQFGLIVVYADGGLVETYTVFRPPTGGRTLHWTSNKGNTLSPAKVAAFSSTCD